MDNEDPIDKMVVKSIPEEELSEMRTNYEIPISITLTPITSDPAGQYLLKIPLFKKTEVTDEILKILNEK